MKRLQAAGLLFVLCAALAAGPAHAADRSCVIVYSQGRNLSTTDPQVNTMWNRVNEAFGQFVASELEKNGRRVVRMTYPVEATDGDRTTRYLLQRSSSEHCGLVAQVSMFADQASGRFVSSMKLHAIESTPASGGATMKISEQPVFEQQQADPLTRETLQHLAPSDIAATFVRAYIAQQANP